MKKTLSRSLAILTVWMLMIMAVIPSIPAEAASGDTTVYITKTGECYHNDGCSSLSRSKIPTTLSAALNKGLRACSKCHAPGLDATPEPTPEPVPTPEPTPVPKDKVTPDSGTADIGSTVVYKTNTGKCYHNDGCANLSRSKIQTTLSQAVAEGLSPCSNCNPPTYNVTGQISGSQPGSGIIQYQDPATINQNVASASAVTTGWDCIYNETYYRQHNPDLDKLYPSDSTGIFNHFKTSGMKEGRASCAEFDVTKYRANNADLNAAYGDDLEKYYLHYKDTGKAEGRSGK